MKQIIITENQLANIAKKLKKNKNVVKEGNKMNVSNYMFFGNIEQMHRQLGLLLELDPQMVDSILQDGHDWADDHISGAKTNIDQVFDFLKNEMDKESQYVDYEEMNEGRKKTGTPLCARGKASAKSKYDVYPSAYANGHAIQVCKGKIKGLDGNKKCSPPYC
jgi:hypothetical protein